MVEQEICFKMVAFKNFAIRKVAIKKVLLSEPEILLTPVQNALLWQFKDHISGRRDRTAGEFLRSCLQSLIYTLVALDGHGFCFVLCLLMNLVKVLKTVTESSQHRNRVSFYFS